MFVSTVRVTKFAFQNFWRNFWLSVITISMLVLTLLTINVLLVLNQATNQAIGFVEDRIEVSVYFHDSASDAKVNSAVEYLRGLAQVKDVETISATEALNKFKTTHVGDDAILGALDELEGNPFGPTLVVKAESADDFEFIINALDNPQFRDGIREKDFSDYEEIVGKIKSTTDQIRTAGIALSIVFFLIAILIIFNTVRVAIFIHREEIGVMKLVGASDWFVRAPFLLETILLSLIAILIVIGIVYPSVAIIEPRFNLYFGGESAGLISYFEQNGLKIFGIQFLVLLGVTMVSTGMAMRKYLKV
jgi:cell division transport system permease protein